MEKERARALAREGRRRLTEEEKREKSRLAVRRLLPLLEGEQTVFCYASLPRETGTEELLAALWARGVQVGLPRVQGQEMAFYLVTSFEDLEPGAMGIREPRSHCRELSCPTAPVITPGLAFDRTGGRAGYGGGYYDRFFAREGNHPAIGLCFAFQVMGEEIALSPHDRPVDRIVTEERVYDCAKARGKEG